LQGRYSVVGANPTMEVVAKENKVTIIDHESGNLIEKTVDDPIMVPKTISEGWKPCFIDKLPDAFCGKSSMIITHVYQDRIVSNYDSLFI